MTGTWTVTALGDVLTLINGRAYKQHEMLSAGTPILRIQNLNKGNRWFYSDLELPPEKYCEQGDLLYAWSATFGPYIYDGPRAIFHYHIWNVVPTASIDKKFAYYELMRVTDDIKRAAHGVAMPHITKAGMEAWKLMLPPLNEQRRIANKLDAVLARVDACRKRLDRVPAILKRFRQAILEVATSGKLTEDWRAQSSARQLLKSVRFDEDEVSIPAHWMEEQLSALIDPSRPLCYGVVQPGEDEENGVPLIRVQDLEAGTVLLSDLRTVSRAVDAEYRRSRVRRGDLLVSVVGTIGRTAVVPEAFEGNIARAIARVACREGVESRWVKYWLDSNTLQWWLTRSSREVARKTLNLGDLASVKVALPPKDEQVEIIRRVESLFAWADRLEARLAAAREQTDRLIPALLAKAFRGELVPQDPADEPAAELLARVLQSKTDTGAGLSRRGRRPAVIE